MRVQVFLFYFFVDINSWDLYLIMTGCALVWGSCTTSIMRYDSFMNIFGHNGFTSWKIGHIGKCWLNFLSGYNIRQMMNEALLSGQQMFFFFTRSSECSNLTHEANARLKSCQTFFGSHNSFKSKQFPLNDVLASRQLRQSGSEMHFGTRNPKIGAAGLDINSRQFTDNLSEKPSVR